MRRFIGLAMIAASLLLVVLAAWLLLRPGVPGTGAATDLPGAITPDLARLALAEPTAQVAPPTRLAVAPTVAGQAAAARPAPAQVEVKRITPAELQRRLAGPQPPLVWELRSPDRYETEHIPGSKLVTLSEVKTLAQGLDRSQAIVTNCD